MGSHLSLLWSAIRLATPLELILSSPPEVEAEIDSIGFGDFSC